MQNNITKNSFYRIESLFHELHPMTKILCTIIYFIIIIFSKSLHLNLILLILLTINILLSNVPFKYYFKTIRRVFIFALIVFIINIFLKFSITANIIIVVKIFAVILYNCTLVMTTKPNLMVKNLGNLIKPLKYIGVPIYKISFFVVFTINGLLRMMDLNININKLKKARSIKSNMVIPLFVISKRNKKMLRDTMKIKYYDVNKVDNTNMKIKYTFADFVILMLYMLILFFMFEEEVFLCVF